MDISPTGVGPSTHGITHQRRLAAARRRRPDAKLVRNARLETYYSHIYSWHLFSKFRI